MPPLISCIVPLYNHKDWVCEAVQSLLDQDYPNKRVVVVDDGSTDGSPDVLASHFGLKEMGRAQDGTRQWMGEPGAPLILLGLAQNRGPSFARNLGMRVSWEGTWAFAFLDADDRYERGKLGRSAAALREGVGVVYTDYDTVNPQGLRLRQFKPSFSRDLLVKECIVNCDSVVLRDAIEQCGLFDETLRVCEDLDRWLSISEKFLIHHLAEPLVTIRVGPHSSTDNVAKPVWQACYRRVFEKARGRQQT